jgi:hypothetical protein
MPFRDTRVFRESGYRFCDQNTRNSKKLSIFFTENALGSTLFNP